MFIQIYGTSGSGKTTAMRKVMARLHGENTWGGTTFDYSWKEKKTNRERRKTCFLGCYLNRGKVFVAGSYQATCGGMDSFSQPGIADTLYSHLKFVADGGAHVLMEGLIQLQPGRAIDLVKSGYEVRAFYLNTSLEQCVANIKARREAKGNLAPLDITNTKTKHEDSQRVIARLRAGGIPTEVVSSDEAAERILELVA